METAKEYLGKIYHIDSQIESKLQQLDSLKALATSTSITLSDMPGAATRNVHKKEDIIVKLIDLEREIDDDVDRLVDLKAEAMHAIAQVKNTRYRLLLEKRYLCYENWERIASDLGYSVRNITALHNKALQAFKVPE